MKAKKRHPERRIPLNKVGEKSRETSIETHPRNQTPPARLGAKKKGDKMRQVETHAESQTPPAKEGSK